jgi:hypothetical protein
MSMSHLIRGTIVEILSDPVSLHINLVEKDERSDEENLHSEQQRSSVSERLRQLQASMSHQASLLQVSMRLR